MRKLLVVFSILIIPLSSAVLAQRVVAPPKPRVVATPEPKPSMMSRIFGRKDKAEAEELTPKPAAAKPTPRPKPRSKPKAPAPKQEEKPAAEETKPAPKTETQPPAPTNAQPAPEGTTPPEPKPGAETSAAAETKPATETKPSGGTKKNAKTSPPKVDTTGMDDGTKFKAVKAVAQEDAAIKELQTKAESAITDADAHAASVAYNKALFRKVRDLEPSLDGYVDRLEDAMMKRLNSEKKRD